MKKNRKKWKNSNNSRNCDPSETSLTCVKNSIEKLRRILNEPSKIWFFSSSAFLFFPTFLFHFREVSIKKNSLPQLDFPFLLLYFRILTLISFHHLDSSFFSCHLNFSSFSLLIYGEKKNWKKRKVQSWQKKKGTKKRDDNFNIRNLKMEGEKKIVVKGHFFLSFFFIHCNLHWCGFGYVAGKLFFFRFFFFFFCKGLGKYF